MRDTRWRSSDESRRLEEQNSQRTLRRRHGGARWARLDWDGASDWLELSDSPSGANPAAHDVQGAADKGHGGQTEHVGNVHVTLYRP